MGRRQGVITGLGVLGATIAAIFYIASGRNASEAVAQSISNAERTLNGGEVGSSGVPPTTRPSLSQLNVQDAHVALCARAILDAISPSGHHSEILRRPDVQDLLRAASLTSGVDVYRQGEIASQLNIKELAQPERARLARDAETLLIDIANRLEKASLSQSIEHATSAEARLVLLVEDLRQVSSSANDIPRDALAVLRTETLNQIIEGEMSRRRRLADLSALLGEPTSGPTLEWIDARIARVQMVIESAEHKNYQTSKKEVLKRVSAKKWDAVRANADAREAEAVKRATLALEARTGWSELLTSSRITRGPPESSVDALLWQATRNFDVDPTSWLLAKARLRSLADELADPAFDSIFSGIPDGKNRTLALVDDATLRSSRELARGILNRSADLPQDRLYPAKNEELSQIVERIDTELTRRKGGGRAIAASASADLSQAIELNVTSPTIPPRARVHFIGEVGTRFPTPQFAPPAVRDQLEKIYLESLDEQVARVEPLLHRYRDITDRLGLSSVSVGEKMRADHARLKAELSTISAELDLYIQELKKVGITADLSKKELTAFFAAFPPRGPPDAPPTAPKPSPKSPKGPSGGGSFRVTDRDIQFYESFHESLPGRSSPRLDKSIVYAQARFDNIETELAVAEEAAKRIDTAARPFATQKGRITLDVADLVVEFKGEPNWKQLKLNPAMTRLPEVHAKWTGRLKVDPLGREIPFNFQSDVKNAKSFKALGGGIHFGEVARPAGEYDMTKFVMRFTAAEGLHFTDNSNPSKTRIITVDKEIRPITLKALYRFAHAGRNAAISVGWGMKKTSLAQQLSDATSGAGSPVLLDAYLVDTPVGQDLILADNIPWSFDKPLPNGEKLSFSDEFVKAHEDYKRGRLESIKPLIDGRTSYKDTDRAAWAKRLDVEAVPTILQALVKSTKPSEARTFFINRTMRRELVSEKIKATDPTAEKAMRSWAEHTILEANGISSRSELTAAGQMQLDVAINKTVSDMMKKIGKEFDQLNEAFDAGVSDQEKLFYITDLVLQNQLEAGRCPKSVAEFWIALTAGRSTQMSADILGELFLARANTTTLATLYDDSVTFTLDRDAFTLNAAMTYRYATSALQLVGDQIVRGEPNHPDNEVQTIDSLTKLVNAHVAEITKLYAPVQRTRRHAEIAALLKWAIAARRDGKLAEIDFADLALVPADDREHFPTADAIVH